MWDDKSIAVLIPAYNEEALIGKVLAGIPKFIDVIIVVDDGSTDATAQIAKNYKAIVISHKENKGLGVALRAGIYKALELGVDMLVTIDADNQVDPGSITELVKPIITGEADLVIGSRFKEKKSIPAMSAIKYYGNKIMSFIVSQITKQKFHDVSCGFRAYSRDAMLRLNLHGKFTYTHESLLVLSFQNVAIIEMPVKVRGAREIGKPKISSSLLSYGFRALKIILQTCRDYEPFTFFNSIGIIFFAIAIGGGLFVFTCYFMTGTFYNYKWVGFLSGISFIIFMLFVILGFILESLAIIRRNQEQLLYSLKKLNFKGR